MTYNVPGVPPRSVASIRTVKSLGSHTAYARSKPRMPKSITRTPEAQVRPSKRRATSLPKASSPKKTLPIPATRIFGDGVCMIDLRSLCWRRPRPFVDRRRLLAAVGRRLIVRQLHRLDFSDGKKEAVPRLAEHPQVAPRIVIEHDGKVRLSFVIGLDRFNRGNFPGEGQIHDVGAGLRPEAH